MLKSKWFAKIMVLVFAVSSIMMFSLSGSTFAADSSYTADLANLWANECYEKEDTVNNRIGDFGSFGMHFADFYTTSGGEIWAYYIVNKADGKLVIGRARSTDGINFTNDGMVLDVGSAGSWDDNMASFPGIWYDNGTYYLVYEGQGTGSAGDIGLATSTDGLNFTRQGRILTHNTSGWESTNIGTPDLYKVGTTWYLTYHGYNGTDCQVGVATGTTLTALTKYAGNPVIPTSSSGPDSGTIGRRDITYYNGYYYMVYEISTDQPYNTAKWSHAFARSTDLFNWTKFTQKNIIPQTNNKFGNDGPAFLILNGVTWIYYRFSDGTENFTRRARLANELNGGYDRIWEAEGPNLYHQIGRADGEGWSASTPIDPVAYLVYGPYVTDIPVGENVAVFKMLVDNNTADNLMVIRLDVYDATAGTVLAQRDITRLQFTSTFHYEFFSLPFLNTVAGHQMEFRIYWNKVSYVNVDRVFVNYGNSY